MVDNEQILKKLPNVEGLLSYLADSQHLYLRGKNEWDRMAKEIEVTMNRRANTFNYFLLIELNNLFTRFSN